MDRTEIVKQIEKYIQDGKTATQEASAYLKAHSHEWNEEHEKNWQNLAIKSRQLLGKALKLREQIKPKGPLQ